MSLNCIGIDSNPKRVEQARRNLAFGCSRSREEEGRPSPIAWRQARPGDWKIG